MQNDVYTSSNQHLPHRHRHFAACLSVEAVSALLGLPTYTIPLLVRARHLKPLGKPAQNSRKWFARVEVEALMQDRAWLDKAVLIIERYVRDMNRKGRSGRKEWEEVTLDSSEQTIPPKAKP